MTLLAKCRIFVSPLGLAAIILTVGLLSGCARPVQEAERFFWPPGARQAKIEYIAFYEKAADARRGEDTRVRDAILGKDKPRPLFDKPVDVASAADGRFYVTDAGLPGVHVIDSEAGETDLLRDEKGNPFEFKMPHGVAVDGWGRVYVGDLIERQIFVFDADHNLMTVLGTGRLESPAGIAVSRDGDRIYVADTKNHDIAVFDSRGRLLARWGKRGSESGEFNYPLDVDLSPDDRLYVVDSLNARIQVLAPDGSFVRSFGERGTALGSFQVPKAVGIDASGHVYVTDARTHRFVIFDLEGRYLLTIGAKQSAAGGVHPGGFLLPGGIDADAQDQIFVVDGLNRMVHQFQYLNDAYLKENPIEEGQAVVPEE